MRNPTLSPSRFRADSDGTRMTVDGTARKSLVLLGVLAISFWSGWMTALSNPGTALLLAACGTIVGAILALLLVFVPKLSPWAAPFYACAEGLALSGVSLLANYRYPGVVQQAVIATIGVTAVMFMLYSHRYIRVTAGFTRGVIAATCGVALVYLVDMVMRLCGWALPGLNSSSPLGIGISLIVVAIAAANLLVDFQQIEQSAARGAPKYFEWYGAFGLLVTIVWMYLELLRLLQKLRD